MIPGGVAIEERGAASPEHDPAGDLEAAGTADPTGEAAAGVDAVDGELAARLASVEADLAAERARSSAALERYRDALLAAEPELPPDLVRGGTLEELESSVDAARRTVARIRERLASSGEPAPAVAAPPAGVSAAGRGFPVGAPVRGTSFAVASMSPAEKIAAGLRMRV